MSTSIERDIDAPAAGWGYLNNDEPVTSGIYRVTRCLTNNKGETVIKLYMSGFKSDAPRGSKRCFTTDIKEADVYFNRHGAKSASRRFNESLAKIYRREGIEV